MAAQGALNPTGPLPAFCSLVCFATELILLFASRRTGNVRILLWLPLLFAVWVNLHVQFAFGIIVLVLWFVSVLVEELCRRSGANWLDAQPPAIRLSKIAAAVLGSCMATLLSPYGYLVYAAVMNSTALFPYVTSDHAMSFRQPQHYILLLLAMAAFFALGRGRSKDLFKLSLMCCASILAFRIQGDAGFLALASVAVIADASQVRTWGNKIDLREHFTKWALPITAVLGLAFGGAILQGVAPNPQVLLNRISESFPVRAANYIRENQLSNPLFNEYRWGGFLGFYLPGYPVVIDGRTDLYGDEINRRYFSLTNAEVSLNSDPTFTGARTILLPADSSMGQALAEIPDFQVMYRDNVAIVLVRRN
jgi:hypothetical protein